METNENLTEKLKFIGLDLENIPDKASFFQNINCRMRRNYNEKKYKVYKFVNVDDVDIFLSPTHRLTDYTEKYAKALPLGAYLYTDTDQNIEKNVEFLKMFKDLSIDNIKEIEDVQKNFNRAIPYNVHYNKDFLWQIFYSEATKRYFMLMPMYESENETLFYLIKKQLENKETRIYVPICYAEYSNKFLSDEQIADLENYLGYFAKDWPTIYEVYDKDDNLSIQIVGKATIYDTVKSEYKIVLHDQGEAEDFYKLLKALFILETQLSHYYKFKIQIDKTGMLNLYYNEQELTYKKMVDFIKKEYISGLEKTIKTKEYKINLEKELKALKNLGQKLDEEYYEREKQISTFLECKKTFLGRVKYFLKYKKKSISVNKEFKIEREETSKLKYFEKPDIKEAYTLEELLTLYTNLDKEVAVAKDLELDIEAKNKRIDVLKKRIKNANQYMKEIDEHKKSIFEFWKFTNKDDVKQLNTGITENYKSKKIKKTFDYDLDFEDLAKQMDKNQREIFSKEETDNIFILSTDCINDVNSINAGKDIKKDRLEELKLEMLKTDKTEVFNIFGSIDSSGDKIKTLGNIKHRENEKNKFSILNIKGDTTKAEYIETLKNISKNIKKSMTKFKNLVEMPIYKVGTIDAGFNIFYINPENVLKNVQEKEINLYKIILKENVNCIPLTNIMYYNNTTQTLPLGMHVTDGILIDTEKIKLELKEQTQNYIIKAEENEPKPKPIKVNIYEYEICQK